MSFFKNNFTKSPLIAEPPIPAITIVSTLENLSRLRCNELRFSNWSIIWSGKLFIISSIFILVLPIKN